MNARINWTQFLTGCLLLVFIASCTATAQESPPTEIPISPTPELVEATFEVTFDKNHECIVLGPTEVPKGKYLFALNDQSKLNLGL